MNRTHKGSGQFRVLWFLVRMMHVGLRFRIEIADVRLQPDRITPSASRSSCSSRSKEPLRNFLNRFPKLTSFSYNSLTFCSESCRNDPEALSVRMTLHISALLTPSFHQKCIIRTKYRKNTRFPRPWRTCLLHLHACPLHSNSNAIRLSLNIPYLKMYEKNDDFHQIEWYSKRLKNHVLTV